MKTQPQPSGTWKERLLRLAKVVLGAVFGGYFLIIGVLMWFEEAIIFFPSIYPAGFYTSTLPPRAEGEVSYRREDVFFTTDDGVKLHAWWCLPVVKQDGEIRDLATRWNVLFFHGNGGNLSDRLWAMQRVARLPARVLIFDYRGYGRSDGSPNEKGTYKDADAAWRTLTGELDAPAEKTILYGHSLGGAVAAELAGKVPAAGLIMQSTFTSVPEMANVHYPLVPGFVIRNRFETIRKVPSLKLPKLFIHGRPDEIIPFAMGERLFAAAAEPKRFHEAPDALHNDIFERGGKEMWQVIRSFCEDTMGPALPDSGEQGNQPVR